MTVERRSDGGAPREAGCGIYREAYTTHHGTRLHTQQVVHPPWYPGCIHREAYTPLCATGLSPKGDGHLSAQQASLPREDGHLSAQQAPLPGQRSLLSLVIPCYSRLYPPWYTSLVIPWLYTSLVYLPGYSCYSWLFLLYMGAPWFKAGF